jgi:hypothetical protein
MAEKRVSELPEALSLTDTDVFVIEQSGIAKKVTAETLKENFGDNSGNTEENLVDKIDFSAWEDGEFTVTAGGDTKNGSVTFSGGRPKTITLNGHTLTLTLPEVE